LERFDSAIEIVAFRDEKGDDMVSGHRSDGNKTLADRRRRWKRLCALHKRLSGRTQLLSGKAERVAHGPRRPRIAVVDLGQAKAAYDDAREVNRRLIA
jgi:hypothetical protein